MLAKGIEGRRVIAERQKRVVVAPTLMGEML
jgi:hypothetical protein